MKTPSQDQNIWFSVSMGLIGLIVGFAVASVLSGTPFGTLQFGSNNGPTAPLAPNAPNAPTGQQPAAASLKDRMKVYAKDAGVNQSQFSQCVDSGKFASFVNEQTNGGTKAGVNGTPGNILVNLKTNTTWLISGAQPYENFKAAIDAMMAEPNKRDFAPPATLQGVTATANVVPVDTSKEHIRGNANAQFALIEYSDLQCPFCKRVHPTFQQIMQNYGDRVMWVYRHFPLPATMHPDAEKLAEGAECAAELGGNDAFWQYVDSVFSG